MLIFFVSLHAVSVCELKLSAILGEERLRDPLVHILVYQVTLIERSVKRGGCWEPLCKLHTVLTHRRAFGPSDNQRGMDSRSRSKHCMIFRSCYYSALVDAAVLALSQLPITPTCAGMITLGISAGHQVPFILHLFLSLNVVFEPAGKIYTCLTGHLFN